jgi:hypothetical protein
MPSTPAVRRPHLAVTIVLLALGACGRFKEENWPETAARASCETFRRCNPLSFYSSYDSVGECADQTQVEPPQASGCTYDPEIARECLDALGWSCRKLGEQVEEVDALCLSVWACSGGSTPEDTGT